MKTKKPDVLVLNKNFLAIHIVAWQKAMSLIIQDAARPMDRDYMTYELSDWFIYSETVDDFPFIHTVSHKIAVPEIVILRKYDRLPIRDVKYSRQTLFQRDKFQCAYCGHVFEKKMLTVDHIMPKARGGKTTWDNTVTACFPCNSKKADRTPEMAGMHMIHKPRKPKWLSPIADVKAHGMLESWKRFTFRTVVD